MADVREQILARLFVVVTGLTGFDKVVRNTLTFDDTSVYGAVLDGAEEAYEADPVRNALAPRRVLLKPAVIVSAPGQPETVGAVVSAQRKRVIKAVLEDSALQALTIDRNIRFLGTETAIQQGARAPILSMNIEFGFTYLLKLADL